MTLAKLFNGYVSKTSNSKAFQTDDMYVPVGTYAFVNHLKSACAACSTNSDMAHDDHERSAITTIDNNKAVTSYQPDGEYMHHNYFVKYCNRVVHQLDNCN